MNSLPSPDFCSERIAPQLVEGRRQKIPLRFDTLAQHAWTCLHASTIRWTTVFAVLSDTLISIKTSTGTVPTNKSTVQSSVKTERLFGLDGLRAIAVVAVLLYHEASRVFPGRLGVLLFFVLSGFLITKSMLRDAAKAGGFSLRSFYVRRSKRILPAFAGFFLLHFSLYGFTSGQWSAALYVSNYYIGLHNTLIGGMTHTWSLSVEEQFYLLWPLLFLLVRRRALLSWILIAATLVAQIWRLVGVLIGINAYYIEFAFDTRCDALLIGCLLALATDTPSGQTLLQNRRLMRLAYWISLAVVAAVVWAEVAHRQFALGVLFGPVAVAFAVLIASVSVMRSAPGPLDNCVLRYVGRISYGIYLYHVIAFDALPRQQPLFWRLGTGGLLTLLIAAASFHFLEAPILKLRSRRPTIPLSPGALASV